MSAALVLRERHHKLASELELARPRMDAIIPAVFARAGLSSERLVGIVLDATTRTPALLECETRSIVRACLQSAEVGLEIASPLGEAYLVPFFNGKKQRKEAQFIAGYRGFAKLALTSGTYSSIKAELVRANDVFEWHEGSDAKIVHRPGRGSERERGEVIYAYAIAKIAAGGETFCVMDREALDRIRLASKSKDRGPWVDHLSEMYRKCPIRRMAKTLDLSPLLRKAVEFDDLGAMQRGEIDVAGLRDGLESDRGAELKSKLRETRVGETASKVIDAELLEDGP